MDSELPVHWILQTSWDDPRLDWQGLDERVQSALVEFGDPTGDQRPVAMFIRYAPGITVRPHAHDTDYCSIVMQGEVEVARKLHRAGSVRFVSAGTTYGPLVAGPEGTVLIDVFADREGIFPRWATVEDADRERLERLEAWLRQRLTDLSPRARLAPEATARA
jgi:hypothetical protein